AAERMRFPGGNNGFTLVHKSSGIRQQCLACEQLILPPSLLRCSGERVPWEKQFARCLLSAYRIDDSGCSIVAGTWPCSACLGSPTTRAEAVASKLSTTTTPRAMRRFRESAMKPMTGGPTRKPIYPQVATAAIAVPEACFEVRPAALSVRGNRTENPA